MFTPSSTVPTQFAPVTTNNMNVFHQAANQVQFLVETFDFNSDRSKREFFKAMEQTSEPLENVSQVKEFYQVSFEMTVQKLANEFNTLQLQNAELSRQLLLNSKKLDVVLPLVIAVANQSNQNCTKNEQFVGYNPCYDPKFADLFHILGNVVNKLFNNNNTTSEPELSFFDWFNPQSAGITVSAFLTVIFCFFDQRLASHLSKKYNIKVKSITKVSVFPI